MQIDPNKVIWDEIPNPENIVWDDEKPKGPSFFEKALGILKEIPGKVGPRLAEGGAGEEGIYTPGEYPRVEEVKPEIPEPIDAITQATPITPPEQPPTDIGAGTMFTRALIKQATAGYIDPFDKVAQQFARSKAFGARGMIDIREPDKEVDKFEELTEHQIRELEKKHPIANTAGDLLGFGVALTPISRALSFMRISRFAPTLTKIAFNALKGVAVGEIYGTVEKLPPGVSRLENIAESALIFGALDGGMTVAAIPLKSLIKFFKAKSLKETEVLISELPAESKQQARTWRDKYTELWESPEFSKELNKIATDLETLENMGQTRKGYDQLTKLLRSEERAAIPKKSYEGAPPIIEGAEAPERYPIIEKKEKPGFLKPEPEEGRIIKPTGVTGVTKREKFEDVKRAKEEWQTYLKTVEKTTGKEPVTFIGAQEIPNSDKVGLLVNDVKGSTKIFDPKKHEVVASGKRFESENISEFERLQESGKVYSGEQFTAEMTKGIKKMGEEEMKPERKALEKKLQAKIKRAEAPKERVPVKNTMQGWIQSKGGINRKWADEVGISEQKGLSLRIVRTKTGRHGDELRSQFNEQYGTNISESEFRKMIDDNVDLTKFAAEREGIAIKAPGEMTEAEAKELGPGLKPEKRPAEALPTGEAETISIKQLEKGQEFTISGERFKVVEEETSKGIKSVEVQDGNRYVLDDVFEPEIKIDKGSLREKGAVTKEPWEMTHQEFMYSVFPKLKPENIGPSIFRPTKETHRAAVEKALSEGKPVSKEVLEDYPDLIKAKPYAKPKTPEQEYADEMIKRGIKPKTGLTKDQMREEMRKKVEAGELEGDMFLEEGKKRQVELFAEKPKEEKTGVEFIKGLSQAVKKDIKGESMGIVADPYRNVEEFLKKNKLKLSEEEVRKIYQGVSRIAKNTLLSAEKKSNSIDDFLTKEFPHLKEVVAEAKPLTEIKKASNAIAHEVPLLTESQRDVLVKKLGKYSRSELVGEVGKLNEKFHPKHFSNLLNKHFEGRRDYKQFSSRDLRKLIRLMEERKRELFIAEPLKAAEVIGEPIPGRQKSIIPGFKWVTNLRRMGKYGEQIADKTVDYRYEYSTHANKWIARTEEIAHLIGGKKKWDRLVDLAEGKVKPANKNEEKALALWREVTEEIADKSQKAELKILDMFGFERDWQPRSDYYPHFVDFPEIRKLVYDKKFVKDLSKQLSVSKREAAEMFDLSFYEKEGVIKEVMNRFGVDESKSKTMLDVTLLSRNRLAEKIATRMKISKEQAHEILSIRREDSKGRIFAHLEMARDVNFPIYRKDYNSSLRYLMGAADRLAWRDAFGKDVFVGLARGMEPEELVPLLYRIQGDANKRYVRQGIKRMLDRYETLSTFDKTNQLVRTLQVFKLGMAQIPNAFQTFIGVLPKVGVKDFAKAWAERIIHPKMSRKYAMEAGAVLPEIEMQLTEMTRRGVTGKIAGTFLKGTGFAWTESNNRIIAAIAGRFHVERAFKGALKDGYRAKYWENELKKLFGNRYEEMLKVGKLTENDMKRASYMLSRITQFTALVEDLPLAWSNKNIKTVVQFKNFAYNQWSLYFNEGIKEASQFFATAGKEGSLRKIAYFTPAIITTGAVVENARHEVYKLLGRDKKEWDKHLNPISQALVWAANSGGFGIVLDSIMSFEYGLKGAYGQSVGPTISDVINTFYLLHYVTTEPNIDRKKLAIFKWAARLNPPARVVVNKLFPEMKDLEEQGLMSSVVRNAQERYKELFIDGKSAEADEMWKDFVAQFGKEYLQKYQKLLIKPDIKSIIEYKRSKEGSLKEIRQKSMPGKGIGATR